MSESNEHKGYMPRNIEDRVMIINIEENRFKVLAVLNTIVVAVTWVIVSMFKFPQMYIFYIPTTTAMSSYLLFSEFRRYNSYYDVMIRRLGFKKKTETFYWDRRGDDERGIRPNRLKKISKEH